MPPSLLPARRVVSEPIGLQPGEVPFEHGDQPIVAYCKGLGMLLHLEMRDGNVSAKTDIVRFLEETLALLPSSVSSVGVRMDGAGYQMDVIRYGNRPSL